MKSTKAILLVGAGRKATLLYINTKHEEPCQHGHFGCAVEEGGACIDEVLSIASDRGWVDEAGDEVVA